MIAQLPRSVSALATLARASAIRHHPAIVNSLKQVEIESFYQTAFDWHSPCEAQSAHFASESTHAVWLPVSSAKNEIYSRKFNVFTCAQF
jgi:hypothetical protein